MSKIYIDLDVITHLFAIQNKLEEDHRKRHYPDPGDKERVRLEVKSTLFHLFSKIIAVAEMSHPLSEHEKKELRNKADRSDDSLSYVYRHQILKDAI